MPGYASVPDIEDFLFVRKFYKLLKQGLTIGLGMSYYATYS